MWEQLVNTALLGTDKLTFDETLLPESLRQALTDFSNDDPEARFLKTAALAHFYKEAGKMPNRFTGNLEVEIVEEEAQWAPVQLSEVLNEILEIHSYYRNDLLELWFDKLIANQQLIQPKQVVTLATIESTLPQKFRPKILKVAGNRGKQILAYKTDISQWQTASDETVWQEGRLAERRELFTNLRQQNAQKALELLESTWAQESLTDKKAFLEVIKATFQPTDVPFLENSYPEFSFKSKERKGQKEGRATLAALLLRNEKTEVYQQTQEGLQPYLQTGKSKGLVSWIVGRQTPSIQLPEVEDDFWNAALMLSRYGFDTSPDAAVFPTNSLYWLSCFIEVLPFEFWMKHLEKDLEPCVAYFLSDAFKVKIEGKSKSALRTSLLVNAQQYKNTALTETLMKVTNFDEQLVLLPILPPANREAFIIQQKWVLNLTWLEAGFGNGHDNWSVEFSNHILKEVHEAIILKNNYLSEQIGVLMARYLHPSSLTFLQTTTHFPTQANGYFINHWQKWFVEPIQKYIEIRNHIG